MRTLLIITWILETLTGLALIGLPSEVASILLGVPLETPGARIVARIAGVALVALGIHCWAARRDTSTRVAKGIVIGMLVYNIGVAGLLIFGWTAWGMRGIGLWPAVILHTGLAIWCIACLARKGIGAAVPG